MNSNALDILDILHINFFLFAIYIILAVFLYNNKIVVDHRELVFKNLFLRRQYENSKIVKMETVSYGRQASVLIILADSARRVHSLQLFPQGAEKIIFSFFAESENRGVMGYRLDRCKKVD